MATSNDNLRKLYQNGLKHFSLPDFDTFERDMKDEVKRQRFYTNMQAAYLLPDFDTFSKDIGVVATDSPTPVKPATQTPAQSQERVTSTTVKPLTDTTPQLLSVQQDVQPIAQPAKPEGWEPSPMQHRAFQMQMDEVNARLKKQGEDFHQRMEGIDKGNRPGAFMGEREFNPQTGQMETHYYTQQGERVGSRMEQSRRNSAHHQWWENNTEAGRRSKEQRLQREFDARLSGLWQRHNPAEGETAAEQAWSAAEKRQGIDRNRIAEDIYHDRGDALSNASFLGGRENHIMNAGENSHRSKVAHFTNFDLDRLMNESWDNLGEDGQKALIDDCYQMLRYRNPGADELVLYTQAKQFARQQSDLRLYNLAVEKNMPKGNLEYLMRKIGDMNVLMNVNKGLAVSSADGKTGDMAAYEAANEQYRQDGHKILDVTGMVAGFALDPTTWLSAGVGSAATRGAMWAGGRWLAGRGASAAVTQAATRQFATSMTGRIVGGIAGGAANFGTFEGVKEIENQFSHGGHIVGQDEVGRYINEGYSAGAVGGQALHGLMMGGAVGWLGPVSGNVSDQLVRATSSTLGKVATRAGVYTGATLAEGTIFSVPEWIEGERDAMDVWNDNMAMMVGFKAKHMLKSAGGVLGDLKASFDSPTNGQKNRLDFESRLRQRMDAPSDGGMALTEDEKAELKRYGYDLRDLVESTERTGDPAEGSLIAQNAPEIVSRLTDMVTDPRVSEAARAKMYYFATGRRLPMSTVMRGELIEDGDGGFIVESQGANGVITSRSFKSRKAADLELERIKRQTELNSIEIGERYQQTADFENRLQEACRTVAAENGWDMVEVYRTCEEARRNHLRGRDKEMDEAQQNILRKVTEAMGEFEETGATYEIRGRINEKYGVDIDRAIRKEANRRTLQEQTAIDEYIAELIPEKAKEPNPVEDAEAEDLTNQKLLTDDEPAAPHGPAEGEPIDPRFNNSDPYQDYDPHQPDADLWPKGRAVMKFQDRPVEVLSGRVVMMEDGTMIDNERSDTSIVIRDLATGKVEMVSPEAILTYEEYAPNATEEAEPTPTEADDPAGDVQPQSQYTSGQIKIRNSDGTETRGVLTGYVDENGNHEYYVEGDLQHLHYASDHELDNILSEYVPDEVEGEATAGKPTAPGTKTDEKDESDVSDVTDVADEVHGAVSAVAPTETPEEAPAGLTALERLPKNEKGEPIFENAESPEAAWDALVEFSEGDAATAKEIADAMAEEKRKAYEKVRKQVAKGKTPAELLASKKTIAAALAQAEGEYNMWQQIANVEQRRQDAIRAQPEAEAGQRAAERAEAEKAEREAREEAARLERESLEGIPEWHIDTPENARKRGVRRFSGQMFTRQRPVDGVVGREVEVKFSQSDLPKGHLAVIEAPQLQPSHIQGQRNPMFFIEEAQPKNRAEAVSMFAAKEMAEGIRPQEITGSATAYTGAPTVNSRGEVIQGNNRSDALRYLWENKLPEQQQTYKQYLIDNAEQFGLDPEAVNAMKQPVLVNMLDVDDAEAIRLGQMTAQDTESGGVERIKPKNVAQKLGEDMRSFASQLLRSGDEEASFGQLVDRNGAEVLKWMAQKGVITDTQYQSAFDSKGHLTAETKNDLQKVLYQAVFKGGSQQLEEMFEALPAKAQRAILSTAFRDMDSPFAGKMLPEIQASIAAYHQLMRDPAFAASKKLEGLLRAVETFKQVIELDDRFEQYAPADNFSNFALHLAAMYKAGDMSQTTLAGYFNQMYDLAQGKKAATLFEEADTTEYPLAEVIKQVLSIDYKPAKNGNNNVANGGADVAFRNQDGQGGELRGNEPPAIGEQNPTGTEPSDRGAGTSDDSRGGGIDKRGGESEAEASQTKLSKEDATDIIVKMEMSAVNDPQISLSPESWQNSFGLSNSIDTPLGKVKMGEGQYQKLVDKKRSAEFGMVVQTLQDPDVVFIEPSEAKEGQATERDFSYVFVKTFIRDGQKFKYYTSVSVLKDGMEVSVSSHIASKTAIMKKLQGMERAYTKQSLLPNSSEWHLAEHPTDVPDLLPTQGKSDANVETSAKTEPQQPNNAVSSDSSLSTDEQSGTSSIEPNGESTVSERKDNDSAPEKQVGKSESSRGAEPPAGGEQNSEGTETSERGRGAAEDGRGSGNLGNGGKGETEAPQTKLSKEEASGIIAEMEERAEVAPEIELTIENWDAEFGESGIVSTPIGDVKMGENQFTKLMRQGRNGKLGMVKPTLENPDIIIEDNSEAKEPEYTERKSSYVYVKTFIKPDGSRYYYFTSVTVSKDGHEVVISNQEKRRNVLTNLLMKGKLVWKHADDVSSTSDVADGLFSPQGNMSDPVSEGTDAPQTNVSDRKVNNSASDKQKSGEESSAQRSDREVDRDGKSSTSEKAYHTIAERVEYSIEIRPNQNGDIYAIRFKKGAKLSEWKNAVGDYGIWSNDGRGEIQFDSFDAMVKYLESRGEEVGSLPSKEKWIKRDKEINDALFEQTGIREGQIWRGPDGTVVRIGARGFVKGPDGWDFATTVTYPDGRAESTLTPATRISEFFSRHRFENGQTVQGAAEAAKLRQKSSRLEIEGAEKLSAERCEAVERYGEGHYCVPIRVIADEADIRESGLSEVAVAQMMEALAEEDVPAVYCREDKKIYIFAGHKDSNVGSTLAHENFHALADAIGDARERNRMFEAYRKTLLADPKCGVYFKELWDAVINAYALEEALEDFVGYTINRMYSAPGFIGHLERVLDGDVKEYIFNKFINRIFNGTAQESSKPANQQGNSENDGRMAGLLRRGDSAGSAQTEGRAAREETGLHPQLDSRNRREQRGRVSGRGRTAGDSGREADGGADAGLTAAEAAERTQISGEPKGESNNFITPILYGTHTKTDAHRPTNPENRRGGGAGVQQGRAGNSQAEGRADGEESAGEEIADGKAGGAAEVAKQEQKDNEAELNSQPDGGGDVRMSIGGSGEANAAVYQATKEMLESAGVKVHEIGNQEALAMLEKKNTPVAGLPNRANEKQPSGSVLAAHSGGSSSNATDSRKSEVKIDNNTRSAKNKIKKFKNGDFDGDYSTLYKALSSMGNLLSMRNRGGSRYTILRTDKGDAVAIRLSDHRANGNNFGRDVADRNLSIVIERKRYDVPDSEIEFTEAVIPLRVFEMHPKEVVSAIVNGVDDVLADKPFTLDGSLGAVIGHHGNDVRFHIRTYHGTGAEFDRFDFGYVGSGEGAQAFGWGGYVTEVKGIGKSYASAIGGKELLPKIEKVAGNIRQVRQWLSKNEEYNKYARNAGRHLRELQREYRAAEKEGNEKDRKFYGGLIELQEQSMKPENHASLIANKRRQIDDYQKELKDLEAQLAQKRHLYTVRIPDDTGDNYLDWDGGVTDSVRDKIVLQADAEGVSISFYGDEMAAGGYFAKMGENAAGFQLYGALARSLGSDKAASGLLSRAGLTGIKYAADRNNGGRADGKKNYVVFKEDDMRITGHVRFLKGGDGTVYGWVAGGEVYLNRDVMNPETPVHEYTHLWDEMVRRENPELWARGVELMKQTPLWDEVLSDPNYADIRLDEDAIASEVHARLTGSDGAKLMEEMIVRAKKEGVFEIARAVSLVEELKRWLSDMFKSLKKTLDKWSKRDLRNLTVESFNRMTLRDLAEGKNPRSAIISRETAERGLRLHAAMARGREAFDALRDRAVAERGIVMPGLNEKVVRVVEVPRHDFAGNGKEALQAAEKWAKENIVGTHTALDSRGDEFGYTISGDAVEKYVSRSATGKSANIGVHLAALKKLPEIIKESIEAEVHPDYDKLNGIRNAENITNPETLIHRFYGAANVDGTIYRVKTTMREYRDKNRSPLAHSYEITQIELLEAPSDGVINNSGEPLAMTSNSSKVEPTVSPKDSGIPHRIANLLKGVEKSYDAGKKLLEESEKSELFRQGSGSMVSREGDIHFRGHERINAHQQEMAQTSPEAKSSHAEKLAKKFNTSIQVVTDTKELTSDNAERQARMRRSKGFYDPATGKVVVVLPNNANVEDVAETVFHEVVAHKGLREMLGDENYDAFCDEVYDHLKDELKEEVDRETTRRFERELEKGYEHHRRVAVDELFGRMAEKGFEDFTKAERGIWAKLKAKVLEAINKFLGYLKLPKWVRLGDNELRYMLWRSHEKLRSRGSTPNEPSGIDYVDMARDAVKREELGLNKTEVIVTRSKKTTADKIEELFNAAVSGNLKGKPVEIGILTEAGRDYLEKMSGITMKERVAFVLNPSDLVHMYRDHFGNNEKDRGNNVPLTIEDIRAMSDVVSNPERIIFGIEPDGLKRKLFYFLAPAKEGSYNLLEIYGDRKGNLTAKTFYKTRKGVSQRALSLMKSEHLTSVTDGATLSDGAKIPKIIDTLTIEDEEKFDFRFRDQNGETGDIWKDQSVGLQERITNAAIRLSNNQSGDLTLRNDAMRAIGGNLNDLRKAMSAQKRYDQTTVKRVADLARILMQNGYLSGMTSGEMQRLLSAVKNSTAMHDISESVQKIMDIMVNNQLRNAEGALRQLLSIRGSKVDARGVEVQGVLDVEGQRTMEVVKKAMSLTEYDINDRIAEALNRMSDPDQTIADQAALEYAGLNMALDYVQNIANSKAEEKTLRDSLKTAKEDRDAGRMTEDAYKQFVEATEDAIRKNKVERAEAYFNLVGRLSDSLRESIENAKAFREAEKARVSEIHHNANSDMEGRPTNEHGMKKKGLGVKLSNSMVSRLLLAPAATFEQIMRVFGSKSVDGEGYLFDRYVRGWQECRDKEWTSIQEVEGILDKKAAEILGKRRARWSDLYALTTKAAGSCDWWDGGEIREHKVTQGNLMYMYMVNKMTDGQVKLRRMCITDDKMLEIEHALDPKLKALADWLQEELLPNLRNKYNETHKRMFGASMAAIENYFPLRILANARLEEVEMAGKIDGKDLPKTMTGAIIKRRYNNYALDVLNSDAVSVALDHIREMETWAAFAEYRRDLCTLLSYKHFRNQVKNMSTIYGSGEKFWDKFYDLALLVGGAYQPKTSDFDKVAVNITKLATGACIAIRLNTALKQLLSYPAFAPDANQARLVYNMTPWRARACWKWAMKNMPSFERRWKSRQAGNDLLRAWKFDWDWTRTDFVQRVQRAGITPNAFIDALTVAMGSEAVYHSKLNGYLKDGFSKEEAHHRAIQDAEIIFNLSQQSSEWPYLSLLQNDRSYLTTCITNFRNSPMSYLRQSIQSKRELANMVKGKDVQIEFETKKGIREGLTPEQAKARAERKYKRNWVRNLFKSTTFDYILPALWAFGLSGIWYCIFGDDEKKKAQYAEDALKRGLLGGFEGMTVGGTMPDFIYGLATDDKPQLDEETSPAMGLITDMANLYGNGKTERAANEMINTMVALGVGVNPQVLEDGVVAGMDFFGEDEKNARDWALLFMRVLSCPQSQMDQVYFDELGMDAREASRKSPAELAERYATYKARRANFATMWSYDDERWETEIKGSWRKKFEKEARARLESQSEAHVADSLEAYDAEWSQTGKRLKALRDQSGSIADKAAQAQAIFESPEGIRYKLYKNLHPYLDKMVKRWLNAPTAQDAATEATAIIEYKAKLVEMLDAWDNPEKSRAAGREAMSIVREWHNRQNPKK